ncbi:MAG: transcription termination/antitermination NusG family protein [Pseudomonadota bacterium]
MTDDASWYALAVETRWEAPVATELRGDGIETYLPLEQTRLRRRGRSITQQSPFLPGYVFVRADLQRIGARPIESTRARCAWCAAPARSRPRSTTARSPPCAASPTPTASSAPAARWPPASAPATRSASKTAPGPA